MSNKTETENDAIFGFPGTPIGAELGDPVTRVIIDEMIVELRVKEEQVIMNYVFQTDSPETFKIHVSRVEVHGSNSWDVYFYNYSGGPVNLVVRPYYVFFQQ
ncbi:hypothetical protein [Paenibacillus sp. JJ1722]|uniref:hypothetical protein n=1 Tax=Paenibacillus sp. JJ1722 TaxID=3398770 RepID=UPI003AADD373